MAGGFVAVLVIDAHFPDAGSLKGKRKELSSLKAQLHQRLGCAVAETGHQDLWQRAELTVALTSGSLPALDAAADRVQRWLDERMPQGVRVDRHVVSIEDLWSIDQ
ncbi:DUF503 domain-containing protein [Conexibacter woesei]|uniref:DUF503 domain-containing protein n=1 Tax=Conexibacter woesei (strain DSM 14684 / CCUG 47730 / CIP 108061 / JCM 11494 / NBRC 100937 / ID131577) TaxID=469383 RepID=D3FE24_CONWI|nr:DUF503 domain-containing protein [Conexibacter woesei]ADB51640.1 protein of unknown function DUF503 [Conexibacter woesei DSM 14684]